VRDNNDERLDLIARELKRPVRVGASLDARIMSAVFRNNAIWYVQTIGLPAGGSTHTAAQWVKLDRNGNDLDAGRIDDPSANSTNSGKWYAYPSLTVNANDDVLIGFSQFSSSTYPAAAYAFRSAADPSGTTRTPVLMKAGEGYYSKTFSGTRNRWGDYSSAQVDPVDDLSMWTVQEYSKPPVSGTSKWSTWWAQISPSGSDPIMALDSPPSGRIQFMPFTLNGWAIDRGGTGTGVTTIHVWAYPSTGAPVFAGVATYGAPRPDVGASYGAQFTNSGYSLVVSNLAAGTYTLVAYAYSSVTNSFNQSRQTVVTLTPTAPLMNIDTPDNGPVSSPFTTSGWAIDRAGSTGPGVDVVHVWAFPVAGGSAVFVGSATYGQPRTDVPATYGSRFANSGFTLSGTLADGSYTLVVYARSAMTGQWDSRARSITVSAPVSNPVMSLDDPVNGSTRPSSFAVAGWAADLGAPNGTGVDAVHVWAYPVGGGAGIFLCVASYGAARGDVASTYGARFGNSGFNGVASGLAPGQYYVVAYARSTITGLFNQQRVAVVTVQ